MTSSQLVEANTGSPRRRRVLVIFNPAAGRRRRGRLDAVIAELRQRGAIVTLRETAAAGDAARFARDARVGDVDVVVAAGGDGTINEAANGIIDGAGLPLGIIPLGTANVLAAEIGLANDAASLARTIVEGHALAVRPGIANGRRFLLMTGVGFDAEVVAKVTPQQKRALGKAAYVMQSLNLLPRYDYPPFRLTIDGRTYDAWSAIVAKGRYYAGRFVCAPHADLTVPSFEICIFERSGTGAVLSYGAALLCDRLPKHPGITSLTGHQIVIEGREGAPVQGDGDNFGILPLSIGIAPETLSLLAPRPTRPTH
jgi:YegS/Rv2252/BmrU family lipid kinase